MKKYIACFKDDDGNRFFFKVARYLANTPEDALAAVSKDAAFIVVTHRAVRDGVCELNVTEDNKALFDHVPVQSPIGPSICLVSGPLFDQVKADFFDGIPTGPMSSLSDASKAARADETLTAA